MTCVNVADLITVKIVGRVCRSITQPHTQALVTINCRTVGVKTIQIQIFSVAHEFIKHVDQSRRTLFAENCTVRGTSDLDETYRERANYTRRARVGGHETSNVQWEKKTF